MKIVGAVLVTMSMVGLPIAAAAAGQAGQQTGQTGSAGQQQYGQSGSSGQQQYGQQAQGGHINADSIIGSRVRDSQGQNMGTISRLMVDPASGRIESAVVATGGFLGIGRDHVQVPWQNLQVQRDGQDVVVTMERQVLEQAPVAQDDRVLDTPAASPRTGDVDRDRTQHSPATQPGGMSGSGATQNQAPSGQQQTR